MEALDIMTSRSRPGVPKIAADGRDDLGTFETLLERWNGEHLAPIGEAAVSPLPHEQGARLSELDPSRLASEQILALMSRRSREIADKIASLRAQISELDSALLVAQREERETAVVVLQELLDQYGLRWRDVFISQDLPMDRSTTAAASMAQGQCSSPAIKGSAESVTGRRWCGKGRHPKWLKQMLAEGRQLSEFLAPLGDCASEAVEG